jgi:hypothetical protein
MSAMSRVLPFAALAALATLASLGLPFPSDAGAIACQSVNGHVLCTGEGAVTCRTADRWTTCIARPDTGRDASGAGISRRDGFAVERFEADSAGEDDADAAGDDGASPPRSTKPERRLRIEQRNSAGEKLLSIERNGRRLHLRSGNLNLDME